MTFKPNKRGMDALARQVSDRLQAAVDAVYDSHANQPKHDVAEALRHKLQGIGVNLNDEMLDTMAAHIADGRRVDTRG